MDQTIYNTPEGIESLAGSLASLNELVKARYEAGYERHERLEEFMLLGRYHMDSCGNFTRWDPQYLPDDQLATLPKVMSWDAFNKMLSSRMESDPGIAEARSGSTRYCIPPVTARDPINGKGWTIEDCHHSLTREERVDLDLTPYIGMPVSKVNEELALSPRGTFDLLQNAGIMNERFVDMTPNEHGYPTNELGFRRDGYEDTYIIEAGDRTTVTLISYYHPDTYKQKMEEVHQTELADLQNGILEGFQAAGFTRVTVESGQIPSSVIEQLGFNEEPEEEEGLELSLPWFVVKSDQLTVGLGVMAEGPVFLDLTPIEVGGVNISKLLGNGAYADHPHSLIPIFEQAILVELREILQRKQPG